MWRNAKSDEDGPSRVRSTKPPEERPEGAAGDAAPDGPGQAAPPAERKGASPFPRRHAPLSGERGELLAVLENIQSRIYVSDPVTYELLYMNRSMREAFGDAIGEKCYFAIKGRGTPCTHCTNDKILGAEDVGIPYVWEHQDPVDGRWYRCVDTAIRWPDGRVVRHEMETDFTEHKQVEAALRDSETKYRRLLENAQEAILIIQDDVLRFFNPKVPELSGHDPEALRTMPFLDLVHPDDRRMAAQRHARRIRGEAVPSNYALRIITKSGETRWIELNAVLLRWEGRPATLNFVTDITERRRASEALSESEERHRMLFDSATDAIFVISHGTIIDCNPRAVESFGHARSEIIGSPLEILFPTVQPDGTDSAERAAELVEASLAGEPQAFEWQHRTKDGSTFPSEVRLNRFTVGGESYVQAIVRDITSRQEAEKELRESRERYGSLFQSSNDGVIIHDLEGRILEVNQRAAEQLGYAPDEMLSMTVAELHPPEAAERWEAAREAMRRDGAVSFEIPFKKRDGSVFPAEVSSSVFEAGVARLVQKVIRDITERKRAEEIQSVLFHISQAVGAATKLGELLETIHTQIGKLIYTRNFYVALYDVERDAYTFPYYVDECDELDDLTPVELKKSLTDYVRRTGEGLLVDEEVQRRLEDEGEVALVGSPSPSWMGVPLTVGKRVIGVVVVQSYVEESLYTESDLELLTFVAENIAVGIERKHAEEERARLEAQVQHAQKLESLGILAGGIAHDFNNLLTGILGYSELTLLRLPDDSPARRALQEIKGAAERAADLSRQMLAYSGQGSFVIEPIDLNGVIREMGNLLEVTIPSGGRLEYDLAARLPLVAVDETQVRQVIMNLITNAAEALCSEEGVITVKSGVLECDRSFLSACYLDEQLPVGEYVFLEVTDTGCGMDRETQSKIFDPFFTTKFTGRGLGLAATLGIIRGHRGTIQVESEVGRGTTFRVLLPAAEEGSPVAVEGAPAVESVEASGTVLLVDDEATVRDIGARMLEDAGLTVVTAADGPEAVDVYAGRAEEIGCVVLDLTMPRMSGEETLRALQRIRRDVRVVLSSGYAEAEVTQRFEGRGIAGFVQKPYLHSRLVSEVGRAIQGVSRSEPGAPPPERT